MIVCTLKAELTGVRDRRKAKRLWYLWTLSKKKVPKEAVSSVPGAADVSSITRCEEWHGILAFSNKSIISELSNGGENYGSHYATFPKETWTDIYSPQMGRRQKTEEMTSFKSSLVNQWVCWEFMCEPTWMVTYRGMEVKVSQDSLPLKWVATRKSFIPGTTCRTCR